MELQDISQKPIPVMPEIEGWQDFLREGDAFLNTAARAHRLRRAAFTPEILYNLSAMGIEKFAMAALMSRGALPYNHTMADLLAAIDETFPKCLDDIASDLRRLDEFQDICSLEGFKIAPPAASKIPAILEVAAKMQAFAHEVTERQADPICPNPNL